MTAADRALTLGIDGAPPAPALARCASSAFVRQILNAPALAEVAFADPPAEALDVLRIGAVLTVAAGTGAELFAGEITAIEHTVDSARGRVVRVRAYDALHRLRKRQRERALADVTLADLVSEAAAGIGVGVGAIETTPRRGLVMQHDQSDLELLVEIAAECGRYLLLAEGELRAVTLAGAADEAIRLRVGHELLEARGTAGSEGLRASTRTRGWDPARIVAIEGRASLASQDAVEFRDGGLSAFAGLGERILVNRPCGSAAEADALAQSDLDRAVALAAVLSATAEGDPRLRPGRQITLEGLSADVDGGFVLTEATHLWDTTRGYITEIGTEPPPRPARLRAASATLGLVSAVDDPERLSRVRAQLPAFGAVETGWMPVLLPGAGGDKGLAILPEPDDQVLVLFPDGDPARGIVLGGLYGERAAPGQVEGAGARGFTLRSPGGQSLVLDSVAALARLQTSAGDTFELGPKGSRLHATRDLVIEAPGRRITIRAKAVEFEQG